MRYQRRSWRTLAPGDRLYDPRHGNPVVELIVETSKKTRRRVGAPAWVATDGPWRLLPRTGSVKILIGGEANDSTTETD